MGSHSVTCHPTQLNTPRLTPARQAGTRLSYIPWKDKRLSYIGCWVHTKMFYPSTHCPIQAVTGPSVVQLHWSLPTCCQQITCNGIWETTRHKRHNGLLPATTCCRPVADLLQRSCQLATDLLYGETGVMDFVLNILLSVILCCPLVPIHNVARFSSETLVLYGI